MQKIKLGVVFGGMSTEHEVSVVSGTSVIKNLNKEKYEIYPIYISKNGVWNKVLGVAGILLLWLTVILGPTYLVRYVLILWLAMPVVIAETKIK